MFKVKARDLITHTRFDVIIKYMYGKAIKVGYDTKYFLELYREHLRLWNGFKEYDKPDKNTFEAFHLSQHFIHHADFPALLRLSACN